MNSKNITAATLASTPIPTSWAQAYTAGNLFAAISLTSTNAQSEATPPLGAIGKEILNTLEAEYFTLETKDLSSIEEAIHISLKHATEKEHIFLSVCIASINDSVLYIFAIGGAKAYMKRGNTLGLLVAGKGTTSIETASGFLEDTDIVILETAEFSETITKEKLALAINNQNPFDIAENLSPILHEEEKPNASAVIFSYQKMENKDEEINDEPETESDVILEQPATKPKINPVKLLLPLLQKTKNFIPHLSKPNLNLAGKRKLFLIVALLLVVLLIFGIVFTTKQKQAAAQAALFQEVFSQAQKKYDEGQSLSGLNKNLARDDFTEAQKIILDKKDAFANDKPHKDKLDTLLKNIEDGLAVVSGVNRVNAKAGSNADLMLATALANSPTAITQDDTTIYTINQNEIASIDKATKKKKTLIQNKNSWKTIGGIGAYIGNIYVLDHDAGQIIKFVDTNQSDYLSSKQDLSKAQSITIDGSIWIIFSDGTIQKWTRGKQDSFAVSELDKQLSNPTRIFTNADIDNLYVLDNGNGRIVVLNKKGEYQTQYQTDVIKSATEFDVLEKDKKAFVLSYKKVWEIELK